MPEWLTALLAALRADQRPAPAVVAFVGVAVATTSGFALLLPDHWFDRAGREELIADRRTWVRWVFIASVGVSTFAAALVVAGRWGKRRELSAERAVLVSELSRLGAMEWAILGQFHRANGRTLRLDYYNPAVELLRHKRLIVLASRHMPLRHDPDVPFDLADGVMEHLHVRFANGS